MNSTLALLNFIFAIPKEFGTNRPTPYTILDKDDEATNKKEANSNTQIDTKTINGADSLLSPRIFSDDASEIIGRFFFGPPPPGSSASHTPSSSNKGANRGMVHSTSFGSATTMSTMASAKGRTTHAQPGDEENLFMDENNETLDISDDEARVVTGWDQDEIDLWKSHVDDAQVEPKEEIPVEKHIEEDWVSHRRKLLDMQKKRWNWDELGPDLSLTTTEAPKLIDSSSFERLPSMDIIEAQRILKSALPAQHQKPKVTAEGGAREGDQIKRTGAGAVIVDDGKQHWMPDSLCKQCYACEAPFTLLRRKHHCRLCGMIFW